jgi:hypothetical protein
MPAAFVLAVVEGDLEVHVVQQLLKSCGSSVGTVRNCRGSASFWQRARQFDRAAQSIGPVLGLVDLEQADCAPGLLRDRVGRLPHRRFVLRIAKRMIESWLLADRQALASFLGVSVALVPGDPEAEPDPKQTLVNLARRSKRREIREALAPAPGLRGVKVGAEYLPTLGEFVRGSWDPRRAANRADSLQRALRAIDAAC